MLNSDGGDCVGPELKAERCKVDYEAMIQKAMGINESVAILKNALFNYLDVHGQRVRGPLAEMLGDLVWEERTLDKRIASLIEQQESDTD